MEGKRTSGKASGGANATHTVWESKKNRRRVGAKGSERVGERRESGGRDNGEGAVGVRKLISIRSRETIKRRTYIKHVVYKNLRILFPKFSSNVTLSFMICFIYFAPDLRTQLYAIILKTEIFEILERFISVFVF